MFRGNNTNTVFPSLYEDNQLHFDSNASTQLQLFGNIPTAWNVDHVNHVSNTNMSALSRPVKRSRETDDFSRPHKLQISLNNLGQEEVDRSQNVPNANVVSTGLRLSFEDDERNSTVTSASGSLPSLPIIMSFGENLRAEIDRQKEEFDHYIRIQEEHLAKGVKEMKQRHMVSFLSAVEKGVDRKLRERELEIDSMNRKNRELVERIKQVAMEAQSWHYRARYNESVVNVLKNNLKQAMAQGADQGKEGCGDSEVDDAASSYDPNPAIPGNAALMNLPRSRGVSGSEQMSCKACKSKEIAMLLLPCRHLCLCQDCEAFIEVCPVCKSMKTASVQVYMC